MLHLFAYLDEALPFYKYRAIMKGYYLRELLLRIYEESSFKDYII